MYPRLDREGNAASHGFKYVSDQQLWDFVEQELTSNNGCYSTGQVWTQTNCIPMGASFCAQGAHLHSVWSAYQGRAGFHKLGQMELGPEGWPLWHTEHGRVVLCQFCDNILMATDIAPQHRAHMVQTPRQLLKLR